jgi:hypothetical protein
MRPWVMGLLGLGGHAKSHRYIGMFMEQPQGLSMINSNTDCTPLHSEVTLAIHTHVFPTSST